MPRGREGVMGWRITGGIGGEVVVGAAVVERRLWSGERTGVLAEARGWGRCKKGGREGVKGWR